MNTHYQAVQHPGASMRKMKSFVALAATLAVMACQTTVASSSLVRQSPVPAVAGAQPASQQSSTQAVVAGTRTKASAAAAEGSRKMWIIVGVIAAVVVAVIVIAGAGGSDSIY